MRVWWILLSLHCGLAARANALEVWAFPSAPLGGDAEHLIALYAVDGEALVAPQQVRAREGTVLETKAAPDGGWLVRYRAPKVSAPASDVLSVSTRRGSGRAEIAVEPVGRVQLQVTISPSPLLLDKGA